MISYTIPGKKSIIICEFFALPAPPQERNGKKNVGKGWLFGDLMV